MAEFECCKRPGQRIYYFVMVVIFTVILVIQLVTLGTFGVQFSRTRSFWSKNNLGPTAVCVLYGDKGTDIMYNPILSNNASCGFTLWGLVTVIIVLIIWIVFHVIMGLIGRPKM